MRRFINTESRKSLLKLGNGNNNNKVISIIFMGILLIAWELIVRLRHIEKFLLPAPTVIVEAFLEQRKLLWLHTKVTLYEAFIGFLLAILVGLLLSIIMNRYKFIKDMIYPILVISQTVPIIALAPLFILWFGFGSLPKIIIVIIVCFFPITISLTEGLENVDNDLVNMIKVMGGNDLQILSKVRMPSVLPSFFSGIKIAATYSIMGAVIGEWLGGKNGLGIYMTRVMRSYQTESLFAAIIIVVVMSIGFFQLVNLIGKKMMPWKK